jgi:hypothetical protein
MRLDRGNSFRTYCDLVLSKYHTGLELKDYTSFSDSVYSIRAGLKI